MRSLKPQASSLKPQASSLILVLLLASSVCGDIIVPGADGSDGAFSAGAGTTTINLANSPTAAWDAANPDPGTPLTGVYDANKWAVVFRYTSVDIPSGRTVNFTNHPSRAPVVWLVNGNVTIAGSLSVNGANGSISTSPAEPGPGGFRGGLGNLGIGSPVSAGFGLGGTRNPVSLPNNQEPWGGSYGTSGGAGGSTNTAGPIYGNANLLPLIGGSGGTGYLTLSSYSVHDAGGGAGGGAILIAATGTITINGTLNASGGGGNFGFCDPSGGSGGAIRLVGNQVTGSSVLQAIGGGGCGGGGTGGMGRIRVQSNLSTGDLASIPPFTFGLPGSPATLWPAASAPTVQVTFIGAQPVPLDPMAVLSFPTADVNLTDPNPLDITLACTNVPSNATVTVRIVPKRGQDSTILATFFSGDVNNSIWKAQFQFPDGFCAVQGRAVVP